MHRAIPGWFIDSLGPFQNQESKSILIMQCFKINIQNQKRHSIYQYQESISILEDWSSKSISKIKIDCKKFKINIQNQEFENIFSKSKSISRIIMSSFQIQNQNQ